MSNRALAAAAGVAESQGGVLTRQQALRSGLTPSAIRQRLGRGRWQRIYPGVYACFSGAPSPSARLWAAVLSAGPGAALSHETAAQLSGLRNTGRPSIRVTVPAGRHLVPVAGVRIFRTDRVLRSVQPALLPPRVRIDETVVDLVQEARSAGAAIGWVYQACSHRVTTPWHIQAAMASRGKLRWRADLTAALGQAITGVQSVLEYRYVGDVEQCHRLPRPQRQVRSRRGSRTEYRDNLYPGFGLAVELDGEATHPGAARWDDIARDNAAATAGITTLRYNWSDVATRPCQVAAEIAAALQARAGPAPRPPAAQPAACLVRSGDHGGKLSLSRHQSTLIMLLARGARRYAPGAAPGGGAAPDGVGGCGS